MDRFNSKDRTKVQIDAATVFIVACGIGIILLITGTGLGGGRRYLWVYRDVRPVPLNKISFEDPEESIEVKDESVYAGEETLALSYITCSQYREDRLMQRADYNAEGILQGYSRWQYDDAGNIYYEWTEDKDGVVTETRHIYEYDGHGRVVHEQINREGRMEEDHYFRYTNEGRAGVSYCYEYPYNSEYRNNTSMTEFVVDEKGIPLCVFIMRETGYAPKEAWRTRWIGQKDGHAVNSVEYYTYSYEKGDIDNWDLYLEEKQVNLYEYHEKTESLNRILGVNYKRGDRDSEEPDYLAVPLYCAQYDGALLLWEMSYTYKGLEYYGVHQYDTEGRPAETVEYLFENKAPKTLLYRYEYDGNDGVREYVYEVKGKDFRHLIGKNGDSGSVLLTFSNTGSLSALEMADREGSPVKEFVLYDSGRFKTMIADGEVREGEIAVLEKFEEEVDQYREE